MRLKTQRTLFAIVAGDEAAARQVFVRGSVLNVPLLVVDSESPAAPGARVESADAVVAAATALALVVWNNLVAARGWHNRHYVSGNLTATAALLAVARLRGVRARELGLSWDRAAAGARLGAALSGVVMVGFAAAALSPNHRRWLRDARVAEMSGRTVAYQAAVQVPLGTVLWEETAFRGVLPALLQRVMALRRARAANSVLFGLWHVRPTLDALRLNSVPSGGLHGWAAVVGAVVAAALADIFLSGLQRTTGSLLAPALVHIATLLFLLASYGWGLPVSLTAVLLDELTGSRYRHWQDRGLLVLWAVLENAGYRQLTMLWRLKGLVRHARGATDWGTMTRRGFETETSA